MKKPSSPNLFPCQNSSACSSRTCQDSTACSSCAGQNPPVYSGDELSESSGQYLSRRTFCKYSLLAMFSLLTAMHASASDNTASVKGNSVPEGSPASAPGGAGNDAPFTIIVATDPHHLTTQLTDDGNAFMSLLERGDGKVTHYSEEILRAFLSEVTALHPDLLLITGDLTFNGELASHAEMAHLLLETQKAGIPVAVFPGNHDVYCSSARQFEGDQMLITDTTIAKDFAEIYHACGYDQALARDPYSLSYVYPLKNNLWLLCIDVNTLESFGKLTQNTLDWVESILIDAKRRNISVIAASHQNLLAHNSIFIDGFRIGAADALANLYRKYGVKLNLSGHMHLQHIATIEGITDIATSALCVQPLQYGILTLENHTAIYQVCQTDVSRWAGSEGMDLNSDMKDFSAYAKDWFNHCTRLKFQDSLKNIAMDENEKQALIEKTIQLNEAYFSGQLNSIEDPEAILASWQACDPTGFMQIYLLSIIKEPVCDMTFWTGEY